MKVNNTIVHVVADYLKVQTRFRKIATSSTHAAHPVEVERIRIIREWEVRASDVQQINFHQPNL